MLRLSLFLLFIATTAEANCRMAAAGATCDAPPRRPTPPAPGLGPAPVEIGTILPQGKYNMVLNSQYFGLPFPRDGWVYFRIEDDVYRVDFETRKVLQRATREASANWPP
jgi:hypothetical protein